jgi:hypothetical protein
MWSMSLHNAELSGTADDLKCGSAGALLGVRSDDLLAELEV